MGDFTAASFEFLGAEIHGFHFIRSTIVTQRRFRAFFGICPRICALIWDMIFPELPVTCHPRHLLWGLMFLKIYGTEHVHAAMVSADEKTLRKWQWEIVSALANMKVVSGQHH